MLARIAWRNLATGYTGHGSFYDVPAVVQLHVNALNIDYKGKIHHWVETEASIEAAMHPVT
jgi:hypothetical protein